MVSAIQATLLPTQPAAFLPSVTPKPTAAPLPTLQAPAKQIITPSLSTIFQLCSPLEGTALNELPEIVSDPYHPPPLGKDERHQGVDFSYYRRGERLSIEGVNIQSVLPGRVAASISNSFPFGNMLIVETPGLNLPQAVRTRFNIQDGESLYILYAHLQSPPGLELGQEVQSCQELGQVGKTGNAGVAHLHLEMRHGKAGVQFPVMSYYKAGDTPAEQANYLLWATSGAFLHFDPMDFLSSK